MRLSHMSSHSLSGSLSRGVFRESQTGTGYSLRLSYKVRQWQSGLAA
jgi:hypothetical protein